LGNKTVGRVQRIGARATHILTNDNIVVIVPNSEFVSGRVINWTHLDPRVRLHIKIGVGYGSDPHAVEKILLEAAAANEHVLKDPAPKAVFREFGESSLNFELLIWTSDMSHHVGALESALNFAIWDKCKEHQIEIPFPQRDLRIKEPVRVEIASVDGKKEGATEGDSPRR